VTDADRAAEHAQKAEEALAEAIKASQGLSKKPPETRTAAAARATAHATLALYYQRNAER
jgi:hypothetical protein